MNAVPRFYAMKLCDKKFLQSHLSNSICVSGLNFIHSVPVGVTDSGQAGPRPEGVAVLGSRHSEHAHNRFLYCVSLAQAGLQDLQHSL